MHIIWVDTNEKVASFTALEGYQMMEYKDADHYWSYIFSLVAGGYRFQ